MSDDDTFDETLYEAADAANEIYVNENMDGFFIDMYQGITVDLFFNDQKAMFGDLLKICGWSPGDWDTGLAITPEQCVQLNIEQVDDFYGVTKWHNGETGAHDIIVFLAPGRMGLRECYSDPGPFDYLSLHFNVLRNKLEHSAIFFFILESLCEILPVSTRKDIDYVKEKTKQLQNEWLKLGIEPGSHDAMLIDY